MKTAINTCGAVYLNAGPKLARGLSGPITVGSNKRIAVLKSQQKRYLTRG